MASYNTIPKTEEEPLIADAPKASHKSTAVIAAVCLMSAVAGFNNHAIYEDEKKADKTSKILNPSLNAIFPISVLNQT